jgi:hypothetical protein
MQPILIVSDVTARLARRGLAAPEAGPQPWPPTRVLVFRCGPVVCEYAAPAAPAAPVAAAAPALTLLSTLPTFQPPSSREPVCPSSSTAR